MGDNTLEQLYKPHLRGPMTIDITSKASQFAGRLAVNSGDSTATVSTSIVGSDSVIRLAMQSAVDSNVAQVLKVNSINPGNNFGVTITPAPVGTDFNILWEVVKGG